MIVYEVRIFFYQDKLTTCIKDKIDLLNKAKLMIENENEERIEMKSKARTEHITLFNTTVEMKIFCFCYYFHFSIIVSFQICLGGIILDLVLGTDGVNNKFPYLPFYINLSLEGFCGNRVKQTFH